MQSTSAHLALASWLPIVQMPPLSPPHLGTRVETPPQIPFTAPCHPASTTVATAQAPPVCILSRELRLAHSPNSSGLPAGAVSDSAQPGKSSPLNEDSASLFPSAGGALAGLSVLFAQPSLPLSFGNPTHPTGLGWHGCTGEDSTVHRILRVEMDGVALNARD